LDVDALRQLREANDSKAVACLASSTIGQCLCRPGSYRDSIAYLEASLKGDPLNAMADLYLAQAYQGDGYRYSKAVRVVEHALSRSDIGEIHVLLEGNLKHYRACLRSLGDGKPYDTSGPGSGSNVKKQPPP
jgi:predicted Zn-dependent protease